jgi:hypothetical protein
MVQVPDADAKWSKHAGANTTTQHLSSLPASTPTLLPPQSSQVPPTQFFCRRCRPPPSHLPHTHARPFYTPLVPHLNAFSASGLRDVSASSSDTKKEDKLDHSPPLLTVLAGRLVRVVPAKCKRTQQ